MKQIKIHILFIYLPINRPNSVAHGGRYSVGLSFLYDSFNYLTFSLMRKSFASWKMYLDEPYIRSTMAHGDK